MLNANNEVICSICKESFKVGDHAVVSGNFTVESLWEQTNAKHVPGSNSVAVGRLSYWHQSCLD